ncbi:phosphoglycerate mutase-like protein [Acephala macrosclerotiorum]|nr:phosphoglycerate mutase-like protein [Acephala macrosclerotiorum]
MRLFLIRHGETVHNVAGVYAGTTDSALTNHGVLQANRLGLHLAATDVKVKHIFSSDLQRAFQTAEAIREAQDSPPSNTTKLELLREQDFGFYEGKQFFERPKEGNKSGKDAHLEAHRNEPSFQDVESKESMKLRMDTFVDDHLLQLLHKVEEYHSVVVVAHGIILSYLWRVLLKRFPAGDVRVLPGVQAAETGFSLEYLGGWSNTGYLELEVKPKQKPDSDKGGYSAPTKTSNLPRSESISFATAEDATNVSSSRSAESTESPAEPENMPQEPLALPPDVHTSPALSKLLDLSLLVMAVNSQIHLKGLKKTRGGIGSLKHDSSQKTMDSFFKKRKLE